MRGMLALVAAVALGAAPKLIKPVSLHAVTGTSAVLDFESDATPDCLASLRIGGRLQVLMHPEGHVQVANKEPLAPDTLYVYALDLCGTKVTGAFRTAPRADAKHPFDFVVVGDARRHEKWAEVAHAIAAQKPAFVLTTGDNVEYPGSGPEPWRDYYVAGQELFASTPLFPAMGNHDVGGAYAEYNRAPGDHAYYAFTWGDAAFVALDTNHLDDAQLAWLAKTLPTLAGKHVFVFQHHPLYSCGSHGSDPRLQAQLAPLFEKAGVVADFAGHDHDLIAWKSNGPVRYFVSGGGGSHTYDMEDCGGAEFAMAAHGFLRVHVDGAKVTATFFDAHGSPLHATELGK